MRLSPQSRWQAIFFSRWFLIVTILVLFFVMLAYARAVYHDFYIKQEIQRLEDQASSLEVHKLKTMELLKYVQSPAFVEERARLELNLSKPGEKMMVVQNTSTMSDGQKETPVVQQNPPTWQKWWWYFFDPDRRRGPAL